MKPGLFCFNVKVLSHECRVVFPTRPHTALSALTSSFQESSHLIPAGETHSLLQGIAVAFMPQHSTAE